MSRQERGSRRRWTARGEELGRVLADLQRGAGELWRCNGGGSGKRSARCSKSSGYRRLDERAMVCARTHPRGCFGCGCSWPATLGLTSAPLTAREALQHHYTRTGSSARTQARFRTQGSRASLVGYSVRLASSTISRLLVVMGCRARYSFPPALYCSGLCPIGCQQNTTRSKGWDSAARTSRRSPASGS